MPDQWLRQNHDPHVRYYISSNSKDVDYNGVLALPRDTPVGTEWTAFKKRDEPTREQPKHNPSDPEINAYFEPHLVQSKGTSEKCKDRQLSKSHCPVIEK